jgi:hypothetical protein
MKSTVLFVGNTYRHHKVDNYKEIRKTFVMRNVRFYFIRRSHGISVSIVARLRAGRPGFNSRQEQKICLFATASRPAVVSTQCIPRALTAGLKQPGHEVDHSSPSSAAVKNAWSCASAPSLRLHGVLLN